MKRRWRPEEAADPEQQAAYDVVISGDEEESSDRMLMKRLEEVRAEIAHALSVRAERRFGPAYVVEIQEGRLGGSVHVSVLLAVRYPVRAGAELIEQLRRFAGEIELEVARALAAAKTGTQVVARLDESSLPATDSAGEGSASWDRIAPILGAVAAGIGVLGLVTFVGGAINWARFEATGLPKEQALSVVPTQDLLVVGARTLVPAVVVGLLACALYTIGSAVMGSQEQRFKNLPGIGYVEEHNTGIRIVFLTLTVAAFEIVAFAITMESPNLVQFLVFFSLGGLLVLLTGAIAAQTDRFAYLAVTVFLGLSVFSGGIAYASARSNPGSRAAAIVRDNQEAIFGFFVAESSSRVYLGRLDPEALRKEEVDLQSARLIGIDKEEIHSIEVGAPKPPAAAVELSDELERELCDLEIAHLPECWNRPVRAGE